MNGVTAELLRITLYEGRLTRELQRLTAELAALQRRRHDEASQARGEARWAAQQAAERAAALRRAAAAARPAGAGPAATPPEASTDEAAAWLRAERAGLGDLAKQGRSTP